MGRLSRGDIPRLGEGCGDEKLNDRLKQPAKGRRVSPQSNPRQFKANSINIQHDAAA